MTYLDRDPTHTSQFVWCLLCKRHVLRKWYAKHYGERHGGR